MQAYVASRRLRLGDSPGYMRLSLRARESLQAYCSRRVARARLLRFFRAHARALAAAARFSRPRSRLDRLLEFLGRGEALR
jgi:hypothetical protein